MSKRRFEEFELDEKILKAVDMLGYENLTTVQEKTLPILLDNKDVVVKSQTGSGKTAAFAIPICNSVVWEENEPQAIVLAPTRELAMQVREDFFNIGRYKRLKIVEVYGKASFPKQRRQLSHKTHVVVGTPGRIIDHIEKGTLNTSNIKYLVIDESDEMFNMGFAEQIKTIIDALPKKRTSMLFSATMPRDVKALCSMYLDNPTYIDIKSKDLNMDRIEQKRYNAEGTNKLQLLKDLTIVENPESCIIFCNTRREVDKVHRDLSKDGYSCEKIHGGLEQRNRTQVMDRFKKGGFKYLIATDVAARGIDVDNITHVINYDIPREAEAYVHRIGRTGRIGKTGKAISIHKNRDMKNLRAITRYTKKEIDQFKRPSKELINESLKEFKSDMKTSLKAEPVKREQTQKLNKGIFKLHINAGRKTRMRPGDIVGALCSIDGIESDDIGVISIIDTSSFVEILNDKGKKVLDKMKKTPIKGRLRVVSPARR